ncbi:MAG: thioredoxin-dependent thiol peroxidase [Prevotellaceae bacterium]|jgi:peroxiredoxin Q/BCP|nr:thioredoxin-dependent thiol peroxidase [Prevotellaceae bacterium]
MTKLNTGDKAPDFSGITQSGKTIKLADFKGKKLILYFYPKDNTSGCTAEACSLRDSYEYFLQHGYEVAGISTDSVASHQKFTEKYSLPFNLIADTDKKIVEDYGVWGEKKFMGKTYMGTNRTTFIIDENGIIENIIEKVDTKNHAQQITSKN